MAGATKKVDNSDASRWTVARAAKIVLEVAVVGAALASAYFAQRAITASNSQTIATSLFQSRVEGQRRFVEASAQFFAALQDASLALPDTGVDVEIVDDINKLTIPTYRKLAQATKAIPSARTLFKGRVDAARGVWSYELELRIVHLVADGEDLATCYGLSSGIPMNEKELGDFKSKLRTNCVDLERRFDNFQQAVVWVSNQMIREMRKPLADLQALPLEALPEVEHDLAHGRKNPNFNIAP
jgi:hypothetical protein